MSTIGTDQQAVALDAAATKHGVPIEILTGVYGVETGFGRNIATSSAGAVGGFQFLPSTARGYNYPLTNTPDAQQFAQQADGAAAYLASLKRQYGSWDAALRHYSGGGYGEAQVRAKFAQTPKDLVNAILTASVTGNHPDVPGVTGNFPPSIPNPLALLGQIWSALTSPKTWLRLAMGIGALFLLLFGLFELAGGRGGMVTQRIPRPRIA